jgi:hypothetical protein
MRVLSPPFFAVIGLLSMLVTAFAGESEWDYDLKTNAAKNPATKEQVLAREAAQLELGQFESWNHHDVKGFLSVYWANPGFVSIVEGSKVREIHGYATLADMIMKAYGPKPEAMGTVHVDSLRINVLPDDTAYCVQSYTVHTSEYIAYCNGTQVLKRYPEGWRIVFEIGSSHTL